MGRIALFLLVLFGAIAALLVAMLIPVHLRALDPRVLAEEQRGGKFLLEAAEEMAGRNLPAAKILVQAAENLNMAGTEEALEVVREAASARIPPRNLLQELERKAAGLVQVQETPMLPALRDRRDRERLAASLESAEARRILQNRGLTHLTLFAPVRSGAGYPLDAAILTTAFLMEEEAFGGSSAGGTSIREQVLQLSARGASTNHVGALEEFYLNIFALAKRFSSEQLLALVSNVHQLGSLDRLARFLQERPGTMPVIFSAVVLTRNGDRVAEYLARFPETALTDLRFGLEAGTRALGQITASQKPVYRVGLHNDLLASSTLSFLTNPLLRFAASVPALALVMKWILLLAGGLSLAYAVRLGRRQSEEEEGWVPQFSFARRMLFAVVFLALTVLLGEPYLAQGQAEDKPAPRIVFPMFSAATPPSIAAEPESQGFMINTSTLIAMGVFLVLQTSIYIFCLTRLAEIRRQPLSNPMKLRLLENEDNLFDAGLYLGLFGTAASLILLTVGLIKPSLVAAYSSTLFGILFVALLKIFHVRPYRRRLLIEMADEEELR